MKRFYYAPEMERDVQLADVGLFCSSDFSDDGGVPDLVGDDIDWGV